MIYLCFLFSGATGLIFENLWVRMLTLVFGSTSLAVSSVLTAYMGGLALGSWLFGRWADRIKNALRAYALIELCVGVLALLIPLVVQGLYPHINSWLWSSFEPGFFAFSFLRFLFSVILLIVPTTLMGGTLPILSKVLIRTEQEMGTVGSRIGWLYTANTTGAVLGTFLCGFVLLPSIGLRLTNISASAVNVLVLGLGLLLVCGFIHRWFESARNLAREMAEAARSALDAPEEPPAPALVLTPLQRIFVLVAFGLSGLSAMNYQVIWSRVLSMVIGSSVYAFALILMAFLVGIALGSSIMSTILRKRRTRNLIVWLAFVQLGIATMAVADYFFVDQYPYWFARLVTGVEDFH
ncbi:MAG: fused MFS/spermidine synthase, partial [Deltaproteobacteria bacterium]|nr:fused MFS/spermidine synthase [Deltaproteobacteria bacterium]